MSYRRRSPEHGSEGLHLRKKVPRSKTPEDADERPASNFPIDVGTLAEEIGKLAKARPSKAVRRRLIW